LINGIFIKIYSFKNTEKIFLKGKNKMLSSTHFKIRPTVFQESILRAQEILGEEFDGLLVPLVFEFEGENLCEKAISSVVFNIARRHEVLRSNYSLDHSGQWEASVSPDEETSSMEKLHLLGNVTSRDDAENKISEFFNRWSPMELLRGPVGRFGLIQILENGSSPRTLLLLLIHHVAFDASSHTVIVRELTRAFNASENSVLLPAPYFTYKNSLSGEKRADWKSELNGANLSLTFPADKTSIVKQDYSAEQLKFYLPQALANSLQKFCINFSCSRFEVLMAAYQVLLYRMNGGEQHFTVGTPVSCRFEDKKKWADSVGCFVDIAPIFAQVNSNSTFRELIKNCKISLEKIRNNPELISSKVTNETKGLQSWFRIVMQWLDFTRFDVELTDTLRLTSRIRYDALKTVMFDMVTNFWFLESEQIMVEVIYRRQLFSQEMVSCIFDSFITLLNGLLASPTSPVVAIPLLSANQEKLYQNTIFDSSDHCLFQSVAEAFESVVSKYPTTLAISDSNGIAWTYAELLSFATGLQGKITPLIRDENSLFAILMDRSPFLILSILAINRTGAGYVIVDPTLPIERQKHIVSTTAAKAIFTTENYASSTTLSSLAPLVIVDTNILENEPCHLISHSQDTSINYVAFTSGTTGMPKPAVITNRSILLRFCGPNRWTKIAHGDVQSCLSNISFDGFAFEWHSALLNGASLHILSKEEAASPIVFMQLCQSRGISHAFFPTALFHTFVALQPNCFKSLKFISVGGEALLKEAVESLVTALGRLPELGLMNLYGPAETGVACTIHTINDMDLDCRSYRSVPIGLPLPDVSISVVDLQGMPVPPGIIGELLVGGPSIDGNYYLDLPKSNKEKWIERPAGKMYRTGDLVQLLPTGVLLCLGRIDRQVKVRSFRVDLGEIEDTLISFPGVKHAIVSSRGSTLLGFVVVNSNTELDDIFFYLEEKLPQHCIPANIIKVESIPLTPNGKVDYNALPWLEQNLKAFDRIEVNYESVIEQQLAAIECSVLGISSVPPHANFFSLGGDSISAIAVASKAKKIGINMRTADVLKFPTLKLLANSLSSYTAPKTVSNIPEQHEKRFPLLPIQKWCFSLGWNAINSFTHALLFKLPKFTTLTQVQNALSALLAAHRGLNVSYSDTSNSFYINKNPADIRVTEFTAITYESILNHARTLALGLDIVNGRMINVALINVSKEQQAMLFCANHLVVDAVSWYLIKSNFLDALNGETLPIQTSWLEYSQQLNSPQLIDYFLKEEESYWRAIDTKQWAEAAVLPIHNNFITDENNTLQHSRSISQSGLFELEDGSQSFEITLASLALAFCGNELYQRGLLVGIENNGRQSNCSLISDDLSESIGWFTTVYPLLIGGNGGDLEELIKSIEEQQAAIPHKGIGYNIIKYNSSGDLHNKLISLHEPQISFNFFGKASEALSITLSPEFKSETNCLDQLFVPTRPSGKRPFLIDVICKQNGNQMEINLDYSSTVFEESAMQQVVNKFFLNLDSLSKAKTHLDAYPVNSMQEGMIYHSQSEPESFVYRCQALYSIRTDKTLDIDNLRQAWERTISVYPVVTNKFFWKEGLLFQQQQEQYGFWKMTHSRENFYEVALHDLHEIDVFEGNCFKVVVDTATNLMAVTFHHALLDGWSLALIIKRLGDEYCHRVNSNENLPQFSEYIACIKAKNSSLDRNPEEFWRAELRDVQPTLIAPFLRPQPHESLTPISKGRLTEKLFFSTKLTQDIKASAQALCVSPFVIYQAAWLCVLSRFMGKLDIVAGLTLSGRMDSDFFDIESLAGLLINTVPHRIILDKDESILAMIQRIHCQLQKIFEHSQVSLSTITSFTDLTQIESLFDSIIVFENYPMPEQQAEFLISLQQVKEQTNFPLSLCVDNASTSLHYNGEKISSNSAKLLLRCFFTTLEQITSAQAKNMTISDINFVTEMEYELLLSKNIEINDQDTPYRRLCSMVLEKAEFYPNTIAVLDDNKNYSYGQIINHARGIAASLMGEFSKPDSSRFVAICLKRSHWLISSMLGVHLAGGAFVLIDQSLPMKRIEDMLSETQCCAILTLDNSASSSLQSFDYPLLLVDKIDELKTFVSPESYLDISHVVYTSGSSGKPKGVIVTHQNMVSRLVSKTNNNEPSWLNIGPNDIGANLCSPSFDVYFAEVFHCLIHGATVAIIPEKTVLSPPEIATAFSEMGITHLFMPTALFHAIAATCPEAFIPLKHIHVGGEVLQLPLLRKVVSVCGNRLPPLGFVNGYGPTEATIGSHRFILRDLKQMESLSSIPLGHPCPKTKYYIIDSVGKLAPIGMVGELLLGGKCVSPGYLGQPELSAEKFTEDLYCTSEQNKNLRLYHTGDMVRLTETGDMEFFGRKDSQVKVRGYRIELDEVEAALLSCKNVESAAAIISNNNALVAFIIINSSTQITYSELVTQLHEKLPNYMIPTKFAVVETIPIAAGGKVDKKALQKQEAHVEFLKSNSTVNAINNEIPKDPRTLSLAAIWSKVLDVPEIKNDSNFFELGGESILAMRAARYAEEEGINISVHDIFNFPIFSDLNDLISSKEEPPKPIDKPIISQPRPILHANKEAIAAGMISIGLAIPDNRFRADKLSELIDFLKTISFPQDYIQHIENTGKCPGTLVTNDWYTNQPWFPKWLETVPKIKTDPFDGLETRARFPFDPRSLRETCEPFPMLCSDASSLAGAAAMIYAGINPLDIDGFIDCAIPQDDETDTNYLIVHQKLGLKNATPLSLFTACTSFISAVEVATAYVRAGLRRRVLVCATQIGSHISDPTSSVGAKLGDGAVAAIISEVKPGTGYQGSHGSALGEFCGAMDLSLKRPLMHLHSPSSLKLGNYLHPGDASLYDQTFIASIKEMVAVCRTALEKSGVTDNSLLFMAPHQPNSELPFLWAKELGIKKMRFSWKTYGSMGPVCPAVNLYQAIEQNELSAEDLVLLTAPGLSMNYYALVESITIELIHAIRGK
jgi:amino acid adenylation domain-containing protein/non-ribosomal peptide synthase protein (TIGR01720 family)